jgi:thiol-disulfide isomerase/thioredoxin
MLLCCAFPAFAARNVRKLSLRDLDGGKTSLRGYQGKVVVLNFWATWCGPCKEEIPRLADIAKQYAEQHVAFILISVDEVKKLSVVRDYVAQHQIALPVWMGGSTDMLNEFSGTDIVPATLIVDENGEIVRAINGEAREEDIKEAVDWLLNGRKGPAPANRVKRY